MPVDTPRHDYKDMKSKWRRLRDCDGGRDSILSAGNIYVPDLPGADGRANSAYRQRGNFYNATQRTVAGLTGAVFQKAPEIEFPDPIKEYLDDITLTGVPFEMFSADAGRETMLIGRYGILIDMPAVVGTGTRPYCVGYKAEDIINWRTERQEGDEVLTMVVLKEFVESPNEKDQFICDSVVQYRVIQLVDKKCVVQLWREKTKGSNEFIVFGGAVVVMRRGTALDFIPFIFIGSLHSTPDIEQPPLLDLADVNLGHWRNSVDYEYGLHLVALPTPWVSGVKGSEPGAAPMKIGPSCVWELEVNGHAGMLEFSGAGLGAIVIAMEDKKKQMSSLGARLLEEPVRGDTATATLIRHSGENASLRSLAGAIEQGFTSVLQIVAWWTGLEDQPLDTEVGVELNKEYLDIKATPQEIQVALTALQAGEISFETWWNLLTTGGWGREGIDAAAERKAIQEDRALDPEPAIDPLLSPGDPVPGQPPTPKKKTITGPDGKVKYVVQEEG
jgi:hypothetical protein